MNLGAVIKLFWENLFVCASGGASRCMFYMLNKQKRGLESSILGLLH